MTDRLVRRGAVALSSILGMVALCCCRGVLGFDELVPRSGDGGKELDSEALAKLLAGGICANYTQCDQAMLAHTDSGDACARAMLPWARQMINARGAAVTETSVRECMAALDRSSCNETIETAIPCWFIGTLADGERCAFSAQCATGACDSVAGTCGSCVPRTPIGERCDGTKGSTCDVGATCVANRCQRRVSPGEKCGPDVADCLPTLRCLDGTCRPLAIARESCFVATDCDRRKLNLDCVAPSEPAAGPATCAVATTVGLGERCQGDDPTSPKTPCRASYCTFNVCMPYLGLGDPATSPDACDDITLVAKDGFCSAKYPTDCR